MIVDEDCEDCQALAEDFDTPMFWHLDGCNMHEGFEFSFYKTREEFEAAFARGLEQVLLVLLEPLVGLPLGAVSKALHGDGRDVAVDDHFAEARRKIAKALRAPRIEPRYEL